MSWVTPSTTPADVKPVDNKPADAKAPKPRPRPNSKTNSDAKPNKDNTPTTAQMTTSTELSAMRMPRPANFNHEAVERARNLPSSSTASSSKAAVMAPAGSPRKKGDERYIITNSHVVNMKECEKPPPDKIEVTFDSGLPTARTFEGKLLALDREEDLAVIRVKGPDLPEPLKIVLVRSGRNPKAANPRLPVRRNAKGLDQERPRRRSHDVLEVRESTVSGRMYNKESGSVKYIEVEGGADPGNSGGAIDTNGNVSAILVAGNPSSNQRLGYSER